jgi:hypothetical protein
MLTNPALSFSDGERMWTEGAAQRLVEHLCNVKIATRTLRNYLQRWGLRPDVQTDEHPRYLVRFSSSWCSTAFGSPIKLRYAPILRPTIVPLQGMGRSGASETQENRPAGGLLGKSVLSVVDHLGVHRFIVYEGEPTSAQVIQAIGEAEASHFGRVRFIITSELPTTCLKRVRAWISLERDRIEVVRERTGILSPRAFSMQRRRERQLRLGKVIGVRSEKTKP